MLVSLFWVGVFFVGILLGSFCWRMFVDGCFPIPTRFSQIFFFFEKLVTMGVFLDSFLPNALFEGSKK